MLLRYCFDFMAYGAEDFKICEVRRCGAVGLVRIWTSSARLILLVRNVKLSSRRAFRN